MNPKKYITKETAKKLSEVAKEKGIELPKSEFIFAKYKNFNNEISEEYRLVRLSEYKKEIKNYPVNLFRENGIHDRLSAFESDSLFIKKFSLPAYDTFELGEILPREKIERKKKGGKYSYDIQHVRICKHQIMWGIDFWKGDRCLEAIIAETEPEARGLMLINLIEHDLLCDNLKKT